MPLLNSLTFESGSKLREIQDSVFSGCESLRSIFLPASLSIIPRQPFLMSSIKEVLVDAANPHYFVSGPLLVAVDGMALMRSFGRGADLEADCLCKLGLRQICEYAFSSCSALESICIPASIEILDNYCFINCPSLSIIIFESDSKLSQMGRALFYNCWSLTSICIPAAIGTIRQQCFAHCASLVEVSFEPGSKLSRIEEDAFTGCTSLPSFVIPAQLEIIAFDVFFDCTSLCKLIFAEPSHLKQLDLPPSEFGSLSIPSSVEVISGWVGTQQGQGRALYFDEKSCLREISLGHRVNPWIRAGHSEFRSNVFFRLSEMALRRFRCKFEGL
jgi:hypothetical protein